MTKLAPVPPKPKYRFQVLQGRHSEGHVRIDADGKQHRVPEEEVREERLRARKEGRDPKHFVPAVYYQGGPLGSIVETNNDLRKHNKPLSIKFKLLEGEGTEPTL